MSDLVSEANAFFSFLPAVVGTHKNSDTTGTSYDRSLTTAEQNQDRSPVDTDRTYPGEGHPNYSDDADMRSLTDTGEQMMPVLHTISITSTMPPLPHPPDVPAAHKSGTERDINAPRHSSATAEWFPSATASAEPSPDGFAVPAASASAQNGVGRIAATIPPGFAVRRDSELAGSAKLELSASPHVPAPTIVVYSPPAQPTACASGPVVRTGGLGGTDRQASPRPAAILTHWREASTDVPPHAPGVSPQLSPHAHSISGASYLSLTERSRSADGPFSMASTSASGSGARTFEHTRLRRRLYGAVGPPPAPPPASTRYSIPSMTTQATSGSSYNTYLVSGSTESGVLGVGGSGSVPSRPVGSRSNSESGKASTDAWPHGGTWRGRTGAHPQTASGTAMGLTYPSGSAARAPPPLKGYLYPTTLANNSFNATPQSLQAGHPHRRSPSFGLSIDTTTAATSLSLGRHGGKVGLDATRPLNQWRTTPSARHDGAVYLAASLAMSGRGEGAAAPTARPYGRTAGTGRGRLHWSLAILPGSVRHDEDLRQQAWGAAAAATTAKRGASSGLRSLGLGVNDGRGDGGGDARAALVSCAHCGCSADDAAGTRVVLLECPCELVAYCSVVCQLADWPAHASHCVLEREWALEQSLLASYPHDQSQRPTPSGSAGSSQSLALSIAARTHADCGTVRECAACGVSSCTLLQCRCGEAFYCSLACQQQDWRFHSYTCSEVVQETALAVRDDGLDMTQSMKALLQGHGGLSEVKTLAARLGFVASAGTQTMPVDLASVFPYADEEPATAAAASAATEAAQTALSTTGLQAASPAPSLGNAPNSSAEASAAVLRPGSPSFGMSLSLMPSAGSPGTSTPALSLRQTGTPPAQGAGLSGASGSGGGPPPPYNYFGGRSVLLGGASGGNGASLSRANSNSHVVARHDGLGTEAPPPDTMASGRTRIQASTNDDLESLILTRQPSRRGSVVGTASVHSSGVSSSRHGFNRTASNLHGLGPPRRAMEGPGHARSARTASRRGSFAASSVGSGVVGPTGLAGLYSFYGAIAGYGGSSSHGGSTGSGSIHDSDRASGTDASASATRTTLAHTHTQSATFGETRREGAGVSSGRRPHASTGLTAVLITSRMLITDEERQTRAAMRQQFAAERIQIALRTLIKEEADARTSIVYEEVFWCVTVGEVALRKWKSALFNYYYRS